MIVPMEIFEHRLIIYKNVTVSSNLTETTFSMFSEGFYQQLYNESCFTGRSYLIKQQINAD